MMKAMMKAMTESLWRVEDQGARLAELTGEGPRAKEAPLRRDVRSLGVLLGRTLAEQAGVGLYDTVERLRHLTTEHRESAGGRVDVEGGSSAAAEGAEDLMARAEEIVAGVSLKEAYQLTKAFAIYFELTNLAETNHRKLRRRARTLAADVPALPGTFRGTLERLRDAGVGWRDVLELLGQIEVTPVFTAHPTEVARRTVLFKRRRIAEQLERLGRLPLSDAEAAAAERAIAREVTTLWQTDEIRRRKPTVTDEIKMGLDYYPSVLIDTLPEVYAELSVAFAQAYGVNLSADELPSLISFGSWIGGDRDGNPFVTAGTTREALSMARRTIIDYYLAAVDSLQEQLSLSALQVNVSARLGARLDDYAETLGGARAELEEHPPAESYRRFLACVLRRLRDAREVPASREGYEDAAAFIDDLRLVRESLNENGGEELAEGSLDPLLRRAEAFGFHLHTLDIRQHARVHASAVRELARGARFDRTADADAPAAVEEVDEKGADETHVGEAAVVVGELVEEIDGDGKLASEIPSTSEETAVLLDSLRAVAELKRAFPP